MDDESDFNSIVNALRTHPGLGDNRDAILWMDNKNENSSQLFYAVTVSAVSSHAPTESYEYGSREFAEAFANRASCSRFTSTFIDPNATSFQHMYYSEISRYHHDLCLTRWKNTDVDFDKLKDGQCALNALILNGESTRKVYGDEKHSRLKRKRPEEVVPAGPATLADLADFQRDSPPETSGHQRRGGASVSLPPCDGRQKDLQRR